jgi:hypothetical protein
MLSNSIVPAQKLSTLRSLNEATPKRSQDAEINNYVLRCVSVLMELPIKQIRFESHTAEACNARMICYFVLHRQMGYSYRQIASLYSANVSMVHRTVKRMDFYYNNNFYLEFNQVADLVMQVLKENG